MYIVMRRLLAGLLLLSVSVVPSVARAATVSEDATHYYVENDVLKIAVLKTRGSLDGIIHKASGVSLQTKNVGNFRSMWGLALKTAGGTAIPFIGNNNTVSFSAEMLRMCPESCGKRKMA